MTDDPLLRIVLGVLTFATALNLLLILRLAARVVDGAVRPFMVPLGESAPRFEGTRRADGRRLISSEPAGQPVVLVFLSEGCASCAVKVPELVRIAAGARQAGVAF